MAQIQIEKDYLTSSFSILEDQPMDMLLGLDMLKKHQCTLDLKKNVLIIGTTGTETPFLSEGDLPACARLSGRSEEDAVKASSKEAAAEEDRQLAEAIARSASESSMDTSESQASDKASTPAPATATATSSAGSGVNESDVANMMAMGFSRESCIQELRNNNGDVNLAISAIFAKTLSDSFNKKK